MVNRWQRWKGIMKCVPFEEKRLNKWQPPYIVQPKYDGERCRAVPLDDGRYLLLTSEENIFYSVPYINESLERSQFKDVELDGELYNHQIYLEGGFDAIQSIVSRTVNLHPEHRRMQYHIFDWAGDNPQMERTLWLISQQVDIPLVISPYWLCNSLEEIMQVFNELIVYGYEGIIVRNLHGPFERKRSTWVMKFKPKQHDYYKIIGYKEEISKDGNPKGTLGALICAGSDGDEFSVGSGFSAGDREDYWAVREKLAGKSVKVGYQHITPGRKVPRFPIFPSKDNKDLLKVEVKKRI